jgi:predicted nucleotidyltransferase component of viral defense system
VPPERLVEEKLAALLERGKSRDFYDLYFILRKGLLSPGNRRILREVAAHLNRIKPETARELRLFLPKDQQAVVKDFRATLERELRRHL